MKVLVACEYSGRVRDAFIERGHDAVSADLEETQSSLGPHHLGDVRDILQDPWDMLIAFPPCTHLAASGARWWPQKQKQQQEAIGFFMELANANVEKIAIENPIGIMSTKWRKPDQIIQPYEHGDPYTKSTCLWLKGLPKLEPTNVVDRGKIVIHGGKRIPEWYSNRTIPRDLTFPGIAKAMAEQWG